METFQLTVLTSDNQPTGAQILLKNTRDVNYMLKWAWTHPLNIY